MAVDWESEGLLEGLEGEAREARLQLLEELADAGIPLEEIKSAAAEGRLVLLPVEKALEGEGEHYTAEEIAERSGIDFEYLERLWAALGAARPDPAEKAFSEDDLEAACAVRRVLDGGMPEDSVLEIARVMGQTLSRLADAIGRSFTEAFLREGDNERELARRYAEAVHALEPQLEPMIRGAFRMHQRENVRRAAVGVEELEAGLLGSQEVAVCFADLVDFTKLGERIPADELGAVAGRLEELAGQVATSPVRLVKTIGDAAMLVSREPDSLLAAALDLVEAADSEGEDFPLLRAGLSWGPALQRAGDWYGQPVNLASRITDFARPASVVSDEALRDVAEQDWAWSFAGNRRFKGVKSELPVYRVRRPEADADD